MADLKISQLTGATTPLAGTEVLPIVQSGATRKVAVSDLTAGRAVQVSTLNVGSSTAPFATGITIKPASDNYQITLQQSNADGAGWGFFADTAGALSITRYASSSYGTAALKFDNFGGATFDKAVTSTLGDIKATNGNFVVGTSGKGIDFSATPGTGTSELLNDYEEGTWTPTYTPASGAFGAITYNSNTFGRYTKVGNAVFIVGLIITDSFAVGTGVGQGRISGLPFTPSPSASASINYSANFNLDTPTGSFTSGADIFLTSRLASNSSSATFNSANFTTGASAFANYVYFQMNYVV